MGCGNCWSDFVFGCGLHESRLNMLLVQEFLKTHTFKELEQAHAVEVSFSKSGNKFSLNYMQLQVKNDDQLACQCRGLILAAKDGRSFLDQAKTINNRLVYDDVCPGETIVLAYGMDRFFNQGQAEVKIDWNDKDLKVLEKRDGTLIQLYFSPLENKWFVATRSCSEADIPLNDWDYTFRTLFEKALSDMSDNFNCKIKMINRTDEIHYTFDSFTALLDKNITYCFELTSYFNRVVVNYNETKATLIAARNRQTLEEIDSSWIYIRGIPRVRAYTYTSMNDIIKMAADLDPSRQEGFVCMDSKFNRVKIKSPAYITYNKLHDSLKFSERNILELILLNKDDDVRSFLPNEIVKRLDSIKANLIKTIAYYDNTYSEIKAKADNICPNDRKTFALIANSYDIWKGPIFNIYSGKSHDMKSYIANNKKIMSKNSKQELTWADNFLDKLLELNDA